MTPWPAGDPGEPIDPHAAGLPSQGGPAAAYPPGYPTPPGYAPYAFPAGPSGGSSHPAAGFAPLGHPPYGYPAAAPADVRPGFATAAAVLGFVVSGLLILAGLLLFLGASIAGEFEDTVNSSSHVGPELALDGLTNLVAAGLLITGGVALLGRKATGRTVLAGGCVIVVAASIYWLVRFGDISETSWAFDSALFLTLTVLALVLAWTPPVTRWLRPEA